MTEKDTSSAAEPSQRTAHLLLVALVALAAALRLVGLSSGLRHTPHIDERYFVEAVARMIAAGDLDHHTYGYPGFFFYLLALPLSWVNAAHTQADVLAFPAQAAPAYLAGRAVAAFFGILHIPLVYWFATRMANRLAALVATALIAVSPVAVYAAHTVRPDTLLSVCAVLALIACARLGTDWRRDVAAGAALGAACAAKFTGGFLVPVYLAQRLLSPGARWSRPLLAGLGALATFALLSPYAILRLSAFGQGASSQVLHHYPDATSWTGSYVQMLTFYASTWPRALGVGAALFALAALPLTRRRWRAWLPIWIFPLLTLAVMATSYRKLDRHLLPSLVVVALLTGVTVAEIGRRWPRAALLVALAIPLGPLAESIGIAAALHRPGTRDLALDWIEGHLPAGARILTTVPDIGFGRGRYEVLRADGFGGGEGLVARALDFVVTTSADARANVAAFPVLCSVEPQHPLSGPTIEIRQVPPERRRPQRPLAPEEFTVVSSEGPGGLDRLRDGRLDTAWESQRSQVPRMWLDVRLDRPQLIAGFELMAGSPPSGTGKRLGVLIRDPAGLWRPVPTFDARPPLVDQFPGREPSQQLLFAPLKTDALRIIQVGRAPRTWRVAELRVLVVAKGPSATHLGE